MKLEREERSLMSSWVPSAEIKHPDTRTEGSRKPGRVRDCNRRRRKALQGGEPDASRSSRKWPASQGLRSAGAEAFSPSSSPSPSFSVLGPQAGHCTWSFQGIISFHLEAILYEEDTIITFSLQI